MLAVVCCFAIQQLAPLFVGRGLDPGVVVEIEVCCCRLTRAGGQLEHPHAGDLSDEPAVRQVGEQELCLVEVLIRHDHLQRERDEDDVVHHRNSLDPHSEPTSLYQEQ